MWKSHHEDQGICDQDHPAIHYWPIKNVFFNTMPGDISAQYATKRSMNTILSSSEHEDFFRSDASDPQGLARTWRNLYPRS